MDPVHDRARRYLLNLLGDPEREEAEAGLLAAQDWFDAIVAVEEALIDAYITDALDPDERERFETTLVDRPAVRARVELARATRRVVLRAVTSERRQKPRDPRALAHSASRWFPLAAALILAVGSLLVTAVNSRDDGWLMLSARASRSASHTPRIVLAPGARQLMLSVTVDTDIRTAEAVLVDADGTEVQRWPTVRLGGRSSIRSARIAVPVRHLRGGRYELVLRVPGSTGAFAPLGLIEFDVDRR